jgi:hypothetical protein
MLSRPVLHELRLPLVPSSLRLGSRQLHRTSGKRVYNSITTCNPERISGIDFVDLSDRVRSRISGPFQGSTSFCYGCATIPDVGKVNAPFPQHARGFLWYDKGSPENPAAGSLRLRSTTLASREGFTQGVDLLAPNGLPWTVPIAALARKSIWEGLVNHLVKDGLVNKALVERFKEAPSGPETGGIILQSLDDPFLVDLSAQRIRVWIAQGDSLHPVCLPGPLTFPRNSGKSCDIPYNGRFFALPCRLTNIITYLTSSGTVICRFELAPNRAGLAYRVLSIVQPVVCVKEDFASRVTHPTSGSLLVRDGRAVVLPLAHDAGYTAGLHPLVPKDYIKERCLGSRTGLTSLIPEYLVPSDFMDLSGCTLSHFSSPVANMEQLLGVITRSRMSHGSTALPAGTCGFFYYDPARTTLRFRVTENESPSAFSYGRDLQWPTGEPWQTPVIDVPLPGRWADTAPEVAIGGGHSDNTRPFYVDFSRPLALKMMWDGQRQLITQKPFHDGRGMDSFHQPRPPYSGKPCKFFH